MSTQTRRIQPPAIGFIRISCPLMAKSPTPLRAAPVDLARLVLIAGACLCLMAISPTGTATEFALPTPGSGPTTIALSPDGTLWFTEQAGNRIGRMAPDGTAIKEFELPN